MKTKQEIKEEIIELYGATRALGDAMNTLHAQRMEKSRQMMALNHMLREMGDEPEGEGTWVNLTHDQMQECNMDGDFMIDRETAKLNVQAKLKELNK
jgi:hypothetical protein